MNARVKPEGKYNREEKHTRKKQVLKKFLERRIFSLYLDQ